MKKLKLSIMSAHKRKMDLEIGSEESLKQCLDKHPEAVHCRNHSDKNRTLLHYAAKNDFIKAVDRLIELGADINARDTKGRTPLHQSLKSCISNDVLKSLLKSKADLNIITNKGETVLHTALAHGSLEAVDLILTKLYKQYPQDVDQSGLRETGEKRKRQTAEIAKFLLNQKTDMNYRDSKYSLLLHFALKNGDEETLKLILREGKNFDINAQGPKEHSVLHSALYFNETLVKCLVDFGADVNLQGHDGQTALHFATEFTQPAYKPIVRYLLEKGADVHKKTFFDEYTPLHNALAVGNEEIVEMLLNEGADTGAKFFSENSEKRQLISALNIVCGATSLKQSFSKTKDEGFHDMWTPIKLVPFFDKKLIKLLLERSSDSNIADLINCRDENYLMPLQQACREGHLEIVELLIEYGADIHCTDSGGDTLIHHAVSKRNGSIEILDFLIRKGLDINSQNNHSQTPLYYVALCRSDEAIPIIEFLADNGAYLNSPSGWEASYSRRTPLHCAAIYEIAELVECLLELKADFNVQNRNGHSPFDIKAENLHKLPKSTEVLIAFMATTDHVFPVLEPDIAYNRAIRMKVGFSKICRSELACMKMRKICDESKVSFFQFLTDDLLSVTFFLKCKELMQVMETGVYKVEFPSYAFLLEKRFERVKSMLRFKEAVENLIENYAKMQLPSLVIGHIFSYLCAGDFRNAARALSLL